ncbi:hypothetical protein FHS76_002237 [Ochrobactrum daejeonense]|uniref:Glycoside hydrolase n=1 Tax=Brucella daejeonensis TaxID=659015 RepID=A0A7W9ELI2_9HYPH|nr:glycoside hydrolase [Brucella daejeonensis]MBB5702359.1 hypothetical protein [Brucella daejeonensis]
MKKLRLALLASIVSLAGSVAEAEEWLPVTENNLEISAGSPLDFSGFLPNPPIGEQSRLIANPAGRFARADAPEKAMRLQCAAIAWGPPSAGIVDHAFIDRYVRQLRLNGYNIARFHFVDADLMIRQGGDFDFRPEALDRMRYLMAALKREGIYWVIDGLTSESGALGGAETDRWGPTGNLKRRAYVEDEAFEHWLRFQKVVYATVNPYTGLAPLQDPALALIIPFNENSIEFTSFVHEHADGQTFWPGFRPAFNAFLKERYADTAALSRAWGGLASGESLERQTIDLPSSRHGGGKRLHDFQAFAVEKERSLARRMENALRGLGYRGLVAPYNNWFTTQTALSRQPQQAVVANTYHDWIGTLAPGTEIKDGSSIADAAAYVSEIAAGRWIGRPFFVTEYEHLFWNRYRYEAGLLFPAYAALQGWDGICRHGQGPLTLAFDEATPFRQRIVPYTFAEDPVARAGETLMSLLFRRGDVKEAPFTVPFMMQGEKSLGDSLEAREPARLKPLALVGRIGLADAQPKRPEGLQKEVAIAYRNASLDNILLRLKQARLLSGENLTDASQGLFESATCEILLDRNRLRMQLVTPRTEAMAFAQLRDSVTLNGVTIGNAEERGLFAASAIDGRPLDKSEKLLIIFASDARNTDMRFRDDAETIVEDWGQLPVTLLRNRIDVSLAGQAVSWTLSPVGLDGRVHEKIAAGAGAVKFRLDNGAGSNGPTTFFLLERKLAG